jgi:hypothetical protein
LTVQRAGATQIVFDDGAADPPRSAGDVPSLEAGATVPPPRPDVRPAERQLA